MTTPPRTLASETSLARAAQRLQNEGIGSVLVTDDGTPETPLEGILTESDIVSVVAAGNAGDRPVREPMSESPVTVRPDASVDRVGELVCEHGVRHIPVIDGGVVGVVTTTDVACLLPTDRLEEDGS